jgi:spermidine synthase
MILQVVFIFAFQVFHGQVYAEVSLIITAFMAGLALGAAGSNRLLATRIAASELWARRTLIGLQLAIVLYSGVFVLILQLPVPAPTLAFPILALLAGVLGGMAFPLALNLARRRGDASQAAGLLYAADLVGGCLGALFGAVLLIPVFGIPQTCATIALVALAGILALV